MLECVAAAYLHQKVESVYTDSRRYNNASLPILAIIPADGVLQLTVIHYDFAEFLDFSTRIFDMNNTFDNLSKKTPAEIANRLLEDVLENKDIERWKALRLFKSYALSEHSEVTVSSVRQVLSFLLEELRKENQMYADILKKVYWDEVKSVDVKIYFDEKYDYSPSSNSYYTKLKEARTKYGNLLLKYQNEDISNELKGNGSRYSHQPSETTTVSTLMPLTSSQRQRIRNATTVLALGITLFRFLVQCNRDYE